VASLRTTPPADLTTLAKSNLGKFPYDYLSSILEFGSASSRKTVSEYAYPAHGSPDMPSAGRRRSMAMRNAPSVSVSSKFRSSAQPISRREKTSRITAK
jgi:hypothetical protein